MTDESAPLTDRLFDLPCVECEQPMVRRRHQIHWEGDYSIDTFTFECQASGCQTTATVEYRAFIPIDIAREREGR